MRRIVQISLVAATLLSSGCSWMQERKFIASLEGKPAHAFELKDMSGAKVRLADSRGKPVLLAFWAYG